MKKDKRSSNVRWQQVELERTGAIPVLVGCGQREADGSLLPAKRQQSVRVVDSSALQRDKKGAYTDRNLTGLMLLMQALEKRDEKPLNLAEQLLWPEPKTREMESWFLRRNPVAVLSKLLPDGVKDVEFVVWRDTRDDNYTAIEPGLYCPDARSALYVLSLLYGESPSGACLQCGRLVDRKRSTKLYCSASCRAKWHRKHQASKSRKTSTRKGRHSK